MGPAVKRVSAGSGGEIAAHGHQGLRKGVAAEGVWVNAEALMPARACALPQAAYTFCCETLTERDNYLSHENTIHLPPPTQLSPRGSRCALRTLLHHPPPPSLPPSIYVHRDVDRLSTYRHTYVVIKNADVDHTSRDTLLERAVATCLAAGVNARHASGQGCGSAAASSALRCQCVQSLQLFCWRRWAQMEPPPRQSTTVTWLLRRICGGRSSRPGPTVLAGAPSPLR